MERTKSILHEIMFILTLKRPHLKVKELQPHKSNLSLKITNSRTEGYIDIEIHKFRLSNNTNHFVIKNVYDYTNEGFEDLTNEVVSAFTSHFKSDQITLICHSEDYSNTILPFSCPVENNVLIALNIEGKPFLTFKEIISSTDRELIENLQVFNNLLRSCSELLKELPFDDFKSIEIKEAYIQGFGFTVIVHKENTYPIKFNFKTDFWNDKVLYRTGPKDSANTKLNFVDCKIKNFKSTLIQALSTPALSTYYSNVQILKDYFLRKNATSDAFSSKITRADCFCIHVNSFSLNKHSALEYDVLLDIDGIVTLEDDTHKRITASKFTFTDIESLETELEDFESKLTESAKGDELERILNNDFSQLAEYFMDVIIPEKCLYSSANRFIPINMSNENIISGYNYIHDALDELFGKYLDLNAFISSDTCKLKLFHANNFEEMKLFLRVNDTYFYFSNSLTLIDAPERFENLLEHFIVLDREGIEALVHFEKLVLKGELYTNYFRTFEEFMS